MNVTCRREGKQIGIAALWLEFNPMIGAITETYMTKWEYNSADLATALIYPRGNQGTSGERVAPTRGGGRDQLSGADGGAYHQQPAGQLCDRHAVRRGGTDGEPHAGERGHRRPDVLPLDGAGRADVEPEGRAEREPDAVAKPDLYV